MNPSNVSKIEPAHKETVRLKITGLDFHIQAGRMTVFANKPGLTIYAKVDRDESAHWPWMRKGLEVYLEVWAESELSEHGPWRRGSGSIGYIDQPEEGPYVGERGDFQNIGENGELGTSLGFVFIPDELQRLACITRRELTSILLDVSTKGRKGEHREILGMQLLDSFMDRE